MATVVAADVAVTPRPDASVSITQSYTEKDSGRTPRPQNVPEGPSEAFISSVDPFPVWAQLTSLSKFMSWESVRKYFCQDDISKFPENI